FDPDLERLRLPLLAIELRVLDLLLDYPPKLLPADEERRPSGRDAVVADRGEREQGGAARSNEGLSKALVRVLGLLGLGRGDEAVEDLPEGEGQVLLVLRQDFADVV